MPVAIAAPPEMELYQLMFPNPVAESDKAPAPQREAPADIGAGLVLLITAYTETRGLMQPAKLVASA